jgi:archaellum component FlaG (FlaF/FlaG flagellin family)
MRKILVTAAFTLFLATVGLVAASMATAHADTGINYTFGPVTYSCNPCTSTNAKTTTTITSGGQTQTFSTNAPNTQELYLKNTTTNSTGTTSTNFYAGDLGLWGGQKVTTTSGTTGFQSGYYTNTGTIKTTTTP